MPTKDRYTYAVSLVVTWADLPVPRAFGCQLDHGLSDHVEFQASAGRPGAPEPGCVAFGLYVKRGELFEIVMLMGFVGVDIETLCLAPRVCAPCALAQVLHSPANHTITAKPQLIVELQVVVARTM